MILSGDFLKELIMDGAIGIEPFTPDAVQPASIDMHLADEFLLLDEKDHIDMSGPVKYKAVKAKEHFIPPHSFLLAKTVERIKVPKHFSVFVEGRSSIGRLGLFIHNAGWVDPGFEGTITLELFNASDCPIKLVAGRRICQFVFARVEGELKEGYTGKYLGQNAVTGSRIHLDPEIRDLQNEMRK